MTTPHAQPQPQRTPRAAGMFRAFRHSNFRLFWAGAFLSNAGTWMQTVAQSWLVLQLTDSGTWLGVDNFVATAPGLALTLVGGVIADKVDRKRLLIYTQAGAGLSALALALLIWSDAIHWQGAARRPGDVWMVLALSFVTGCCWAISGPSYQAITVDLVEREDVANAVALNSSQFQLARVVGPLLAALTIRFFGMAGCFLANGLSYVAIVLALSRVRFKKHGAAPVGKGFDGKAAEQASAQTAVAQTAVAQTAVAQTADAQTAAAQTAAAQTAQAASPPARATMWGDLAEGIGYVRMRPRVRLILLCSTVVSLFGTPYLVLMPLFARDVYGWDEAGLSLLMGTAGAGALVGALTLAYLGDATGKGRMLVGSMVAGGAGIAAFAAAASPRWGVPVLFGVGASMVCFFALGNTLLQQLVRDEMRGRVMSMWILTFIGTMPVGSFLSGAAADRFGTRPVLAACGLVVLLFGLLVGARGGLREM